MEMWWCQGATWGNVQLRWWWLWILTDLFSKTDHIPWNCSVIFFSLICKNLVSARHAMYRACRTVDFHSETEFSIQFMNRKTLKKTLFYSFWVYTAKSMPAYPWRWFEQNIKETRELRMITHTHKTNTRRTLSVCCRPRQSCVLKLITQDSCASVSNALEIIHEVRIFMVKWIPLW